jgi:hypothetical protein
MKKRASILLLASLLTGAASAQGYAKGVNPADNLTRADVALGWAELDDESFRALSLGYEHRLGENWGVGAFLSPLAYFDGDVGTGDFGIGGRFIEAEGDWQLGASLAFAGSTGTLSAIGTGRFRVVPAALVVRPWSAEDFTAFEAAWVEWLSQGNDFAVLSLAQGHLFPSGWFVVGDVSYRTFTSQTDGGVRLGLEAGKQLDERWQVALRPGYSFDGLDGPNVEIRASYFF